MENKKSRKQSDIITVWKQDGNADDFGNPFYSAPVHYYVRYEDRTTTFIDSNGNQSRGRATLHVEMPAGSEHIMSLNDKVVEGKVTSTVPPFDAFFCKDRRRDKNLSGSRVVFRYTV